MCVNFCNEKYPKISTMSTPDISHLTADDLNYVYEPAEDSFLLIDAIEKEMPIIAKLRPTIILEIGSGSGICSTFLAQQLSSPACFLCTDKNARAAAVTRKTGEVNHVSLEPIVTDLVNGLQDRLAGSVDVLLFNPPYVVTPSQEPYCKVSMSRKDDGREISSHGIEASWAGGVDGREVMDRLFPHVPSLLSASGIFYLVIIKENNAAEIETLLAAHGFKMVVVMTRRSGPEFLSVLKFYRQT